MVSLLVEISQLIVQRCLVVICLTLSKVEKVRVNVHLDLFEAPMYPPHMPGKSVDPKRHELIVKTKPESGNAI